MIDKNKTYRTRDGREVRIYAVDGDADLPVHGAILTKWGWQASTWTPNGLWAVDMTDGSDLIEVKPRIQREVWVNVFRNGVEAYSFKHAADYNGGHRIACVRLTIDCEEGDGL
jgi:hypothetical protein